MNKAHERPACGIRRMPNAHQRLPGPQDLPQQHATPRNFMGWNSAFPSFPAGTRRPAEFVEYRTFGDDPGAIMRFGGLEIYFKEIPQAKELQSGQVGYEHVGVYVPHLETSVESLVKGFGCTLASMPANQNRVAFVRGPENLMLELIEA